MVTTRLTGEEIEELKQEATTHFWPHKRMAGDMSDETGVKLVTKAKGVWVEDAEGKQWFDTISGLWLKNIGHGRQEIAEAVYKQMQDISFSPAGTVSPAAVKLAAKLAGLAPDKESRVYFVSGGSEAVETALKMAKNYHYNNDEPGRWKVISRSGSYHGATFACMSLGSTGDSKVGNFGPLMPGNVHVTPPNQYRCVHCSDRGGCNLECARDVERAIEHEIPSTVAAFIGEPVSISAGIHVPHPEYWPTIREICHRYGVLMICDEVITGFGRTGKMFATEHWNVNPDIFTVAKGLTSGYMPMGAAVASRKVADAFLGDDEAAFPHIMTFGGSPAAAAAGLANLEILEGERLIENSALMGEYFFQQLQTLYEHRIVGDVRGGFGLIGAIELVKDRETKEKFPKEAQLSKKLGMAMARHGLIARGGEIIMLAPPLCVTRDEVDYLVHQVNAVVDDLESTL